MTKLNDDPLDIAEYLIQENGIDSAIQVTSDGIMKSQQDGDNYALSVWREVKVILRNKKTRPEGQASYQGGPEGRLGGAQVKKNPLV